MANQNVVGNVNGCLLRPNDHKKAVEAMINLGDNLRENLKFDEAVLKFQEAKDYVAENFQTDGICKTEFEYRIDCGLLYGLKTKELLDPLKEFIEKYSIAKMGKAMEQSFNFHVANNFILLEKYEDARPYLDKSMELLKEIDKKYMSNIMTAEIYCLYIDINVYEKNVLETQEYLQKGLALTCISQNPQLHISFLGYQRKHVPRKKRIEISKKMYQMCIGKKKDLLIGNKLDACYSLFEDYFFENDENDMVKAEEYLWRIWSDKKALKYHKEEEKCEEGNECEKDKESVEGRIKKCLIFMYKLPQRLKDIIKFETERNFEEVVLIYNQLGMELHKIGTFEAAYDFWQKMKEAAEKITEFTYYTKDEYIKAALEFIALSFYEIAVCQNDFKKLLVYLNELYKKQEELDATDTILIPIKFLQARIFALLDDIPYEEKKQAFSDVKNELFTDYQKYKYLCDYIKLIKRRKNETDKAKLLNLQVDLAELSNLENDLAELPDLQNELEILKEKIKNGKKVPPPYMDISYSNENDDIPDEEILSKLEKKWKKFDKIQVFKNIEDKDAKLQNAILSKDSDLNYIKFFIEDCEYGEVINGQDFMGLTPLYHAVKIGRNDIVEYFISKNVDINLSSTHKNSDAVPFGSTPLMEAVRQKNPQIIRLLIEANANPLMAESNGKTALKLLNGLIENNGSQKSSKKKADPIPESLLEELRETQNLLMEAEQKFMDEDGGNQGEQTENQPPQKSDNKRKRQQPARFTGDEVPKKTRKR